MKGLAMLGILAIAGAANAQDEVNFKVLEMPAVFSTIREYKVMTIRSAREWQSYWNRYVSANIEVEGAFKPMPLPDIDFKQFEVVAVHFGTQPTSGMKVNVLSAILDNDAYTLTVEKSYGPMAMLHSSNPAVLIRLPKTHGPVVVLLKKGDTKDQGGSSVRHRSLSGGG
jgi:hypothetical protein